MAENKIKMKIKYSEVEKRINEATIADSLLILLFVGIMVYQHTIGPVIPAYIYLEIGVLVVSVILFFSQQKKLLFTGIIAGIFWAFFVFILWLLYELFINGLANFAGFLIMIGIPLYLLYQNTIAFTGLLRYRKDSPENKTPENTDKI
jgi:hypothetical protein